MGNSIIMIFNTSRAKIKLCHQMKRITWLQFKILWMVRKEIDSNMASFHCTVHTKFVGLHLKDFLLTIYEDTVCGVLGMRISWPSCVVLLQHVTQAFCDCFNKSLEGVSPFTLGADDGFTQLQLSSLPIVKVLQGHSEIKSKQTFNLLSNMYLQKCFT